MTSPHRFRVTVELLVEVTDAAALAEWATATVSGTEFTGDAVRTPEQERQDELDGVRDNPLEAILWASEPDAVLADRPGVDVLGTVLSAEPEGGGDERVPDFGALFPPCACDASDDCADCGGWQLTARTAAVLWQMLQVLADQAYDDVEGHGDDPVEPDAGWALFDRYPRLTWRQDAVWRRQAARACDDLAADVAAGRWPSPRCAAEEMAMHLALRDALAAVQDGWADLDTAFAHLPEHRDDLDWDMCLEVLFQDHDILDLFTASLDGLEDPDNDQNREMGIGDYRPAAWFRTFDNAEPRDGRRPFRR